jgi:catecholate siderophore receptor
LRVEAFGQDIQSTRDIVHNKDSGVAPSLRFGIGTPTEVTLSGLFQHNRDLPDYGFPLIRTSNGGVGTVRKPVDAPDNRYYGYLDDHFDQDVSVVSAVIRHKISPTLTFRNQTQYSEYEIDASPSPLGTVSRVGGGVPSFNDPLSILNAQRQDRDRKLHDKSLFNQSELIAKLQSGAVLHTVTTGLEIGRDEYQEDRYAWNPTNVTINLGNPVNGYRPGARRLSRVAETTADTVGVYINDQIDLDKQWKVVAGLRWDRFKTHSNLQKFMLPAGFSADTTVVAPDHTDTMLSPRTGVIYQPTDAASYYVSYGVSFNPTAETINASGSAATSASANLDPEKNRSIEVGAKLDFLGGNLSFNSAVFRVEKTNARTTDPVTGVISLDGDIRVQGVELGVIGRITPAWQVMAGYTLLDGKIVKSLETGANTATNNLDAGLRAEGKMPQNTPRNSASVWTTYGFLGNWEAGGGLLYSSKRYVNNFETAQIDGYTRADATLAYKQKSYDLRLNLQNLTDKKYFEAASGGRATPVRGRTAILTMAYRF